MSAEKDVWVECNHLTRYSCGATVHADTVTEARKIAAERGWQINAPGGLDYCPEHRTTKPKGTTT